VDWIAANYIDMSDFTGVKPLPHTFWSEETTKTAEAPAQEAEAANTARNQVTRKEEGVTPGAKPKRKCTHRGRTNHASRFCRQAKKAGKTTMRAKREATEGRSEVGRQVTRTKKLPLIVASEAQLENLKERMKKERASVLAIAIP
jgi:choline dehydrogenase-like flavoprotein